MADTILILGNGFDIAMGRKTKYTDFIDFEKQLFSNPNEDLLEFLKVKNIRIEKYKDNLYLKFINENKATLGDNWSNLEIMISQLADAIMYFKENNDLIFKVTITGQTGLLDEKLSKEKNYRSKLYISDLFFLLFHKKVWGSLEREVAMEKLNNEFINQLDLLIELLEIYLSYRDFLDFKVIEIKSKPTALDAISDLSNSSVLNFNYTNTSRYLFGTSEKRTHFIHGRIDLIRTFSRINTMVFGIEDKENDVNSDLIPYQKYYQRVVKETGNDFEKFFKRTFYDIDDEFGSQLPNSKNIIVFGHSVDPLDKEIFQKCFALAENGKYDYRFIFTYFNDLAKRSIIKNLAIILGKEKLIELTGKQNVVFIKSDDKDSMKEVLLP
ncbi:MULTISPECIES: AbiH family protein [Streptococcus]|uniref:Phage abortive infection protein n=1 Tax=Streptococcus oralis subsp. oralis TaxID=1891914 RepID=A0A1X1HH60_STROR|nr:MULTISPECIES: AbiH family protein [Streptococcus]MCY7080155.1 bacteriophage abortive infection AbiH family protein [Streptococcus oralis]OFO21954.1 phage abortive infection protein [Streptococcus sp. HMSC072D05]ORO60177.1 phage abortive infection protein [Streptococcus oralis subsp. oralis]